MYFKPCFFTRRLFVFITILFCFATSYGQIGFKASMLSPTADIGPFFKKAPSYDIFGVGQMDNVRTKVGINFTNFSPRLDTFPSVMFSINPDRVIPGFVTYSKFNMWAFFFDVDIQLLERNNFWLFAGAGATGGFANVVYYEDYETVITGQSDLSFKYTGLRFNFSAEYLLKEHFLIFAQVTKQSLISEKGESQLGNHSFGLGITYYLTPQ